MAITIRELLASDTVSQAADKINFNFDQLLLNGGGPQGPQGPQGPPGPIGGRGIRGSVWYEGTIPPTATFPTATPEDEDNYLQSNGVVWTYDAAIPGWVNTTINLQGPIGPAGSSGKFAEYQAIPYTAAGDTTIFPDEMSPAAYSALNQGVRSVLIGGFPESPAFTPTSSGTTRIVPQSIAQNLEKNSYTLMLHQFDANDTALVFHGGDATSDFEQIAINKLSFIKLEVDDALRIVSPKARTGSNATPGVYIEATNRGIDLKAGRELTIRTGTAAASDTYAGQDNFRVQVAQSAGNATEPYASISTVVGGQEAELRIGETSTPVTTTANPGNLVGLAGKISLIGSDAMNLRTGTNIIVNAGTDIDINAGSTIDMIGAGLVTVQSTGNNLRLWATAGASLVDVFSEFDVDVRTKTGDVHIFTGTSTGGDILIDTDNTGSQIKLETNGNTAPIELITTGNTSPINITTTTNSSIINIETLGASSPINLLTAGSGINMAATGVGGITLAGALGVTLNSAAGNIALSTSTASSLIQLNATAASSLIQLNATGSGAAVNVNALTGVNPSTIVGTNVKVTGSNHITHTTQLTTSLDNDIMLSGSYSANAISGSSNIIISSWIRIGNVVTFSGGGTCSYTSSLIFDLPIKGPIGGIGSGTATVLNNTTPALSVRTVSCIGSTFSIRDQNGGAAPGVLDTSFTFSFTYILN